MISVRAEQGDAPLIALIAAILSDLKKGVVHCVVRLLDLFHILVLSFILFVFFFFFCRWNCFCCH